MQSGCVICQDPFDAAVGIVTTKCGHIFHNSCIEQWLARSCTCPECRSKVCTKSLTKLFFNFSFDDKSGDTAEKSLDALKKQLHEKGLEIMEKDKKIKKLQTHCARAEREEEKMHQIVMELRNQVHAMQREMQSLGRIEAKNHKLLQENNNLQSELEHLNNIKTIVEGSSNDTKNILRDMQAPVSSEEGKVAFDRIATYCSVIKRELSCSMEEKTQLQNELTNVKRKMGILQAKDAKKRKQLEQQIKTLEDLNSALSERKADGSHSIPISPCSPNNHTVERRNFVESTLLCKDSPVTFDIPENKKQKMNIVVVDKHPKQVSFTKKRFVVPSAFKLTKPDLVAMRNRRREDSVSRVGYNGLGGHGCFIIGTGKINQR